MRLYSAFSMPISVERTLADKMGVYKRQAGCTIVWWPRRGTANMSAGPWVVGDLKKLSHAGEEIF